MGGRIYHPRLRRFLTADPIVAVPAGQGLNAYSYVMGMPTGFTDPTGWVGEETEPASEPNPPRVMTNEEGEQELTWWATTSPTGDAPANETAGAGAAGVAQASDTEVAGPSRAGRVRGRRRGRQTRALRVGLAGFLHRSEGSGDTRDVHQPTQIGAGLGQRRHHDRRAGIA